MYILFSLQAAQNAESQARSPPPSYCAGDTREDANTPPSSPVLVSVSQSQPATNNDTTVTVTASPQLPAAPTAVAARGTTTPDPRTLQIPESFQSLDNIDLAIFGSVARLTDSSTAINSQMAAATDSSNSGVIIDAAAFFSGTRAPARLMTPRFQPRPHRGGGHVFDPTALRRVDEVSMKTTQRNVRGGFFTRL